MPIMAYRATVDDHAGTPPRLRVSGRNGYRGGIAGAAHLDPLHRAAQASSSSSAQDRPSLHLSERSSPVKNRKRQIRTYGSVRGEDGNILAYSALVFGGAVSVYRVAQLAGQPIW